MINNILSVLYLLAAFALTLLAAFGYIEAEGYKVEFFSFLILFHILIYAKD